MGVLGVISGFRNNQEPDNSYSSAASSNLADVDRQILDVRATTANGNTCISPDTCYRARPALSGVCARHLV